MVVKRGDIFYADLSPVIGSEQGGVRPVLVVQNDVGNRFSPTVIISAITSQINKAKMPTHIEIAAADYGRMTTYDGVTGFRISYCPLSYVTTVVANDATDLTADTELQNLMKALYLYYQAADAYNQN